MRTPLVCLAYFVLLATLAVGVDRLVAQRTFQDPAELVPAYRSFQEPSVGAKLQDLSQSDSRFDTLFLGNSRTLFAVQPEVVDGVLAGQGLDRRSFNLAFPTVDVRFWPAFLERYYDRAPPRDLVLGITPRDLDARNTAAVAEAQAFGASPGFENRDRTAVWRAAEEGLAELFTLRGRFNELRRAGPGSLVSGDGLDPAQIRVGERGWGKFAPGVTPEKAELGQQAEALATRTGTMRLQVGRDQIGALEHLDRWIRARGGCLTLFTLPLLYDREPWGTVEVRQDFERTMRDFVAANPTVGFVDIGPRVQGAYTLADWGDGDHLDPSGARRFSRQLGEALGRRLGHCRTGERRALPPLSPLAQPRPAE